MPVDKIPTVTLSGLLVTYFNADPPIFGTIIRILEGTPYTKRFPSSPSNEFSRYLVKVGYGRDRSWTIVQE